MNLDLIYEFYQWYFAVGVIGGILLGVFSTLLVISIRESNDTKRRLNKLRSKEVVE